MRARNIKPGFFKNEVLCKLDAYARILFEGLWCIADRAGRLEDRPTRIKVEVLPYDECDVDKLLCDLDKAEFIRRYSVNGSKYIEITNFLKHQSPHIKESESYIPAPNKQGMNTKRTRDRHGVKTPDSLIPDSLIPDSPFSESLFSSFEVFWKEYPKKIGKGYAKKIFIKVRPDQDLLKKMLEKIKLFKETPQWQKDNGQFIPHPATWLNQGRWEDEINEQQIITPQPGLSSWLRKRTEAQNERR